MEPTLFYGVVPSEQVTEGDMKIRLQVMYLDDLRARIETEGCRLLDYPGEGGVLSFGLAIPDSIVEAHSWGQITPASMRMVDPAWNPLLISVASLLGWETAKMTPRWRMFPPTFPVPAPAQPTPVFPFIKPR